MVHGNMVHIHVEFRLNTFSTTTSKSCCMSAVQSGGGIAALDSDMLEFGGL